MAGESNQLFSFSFSLFFFFLSLVDLSTFCQAYVARLANRQARVVPSEPVQSVDVPFSVLSMSGDAAVRFFVVVCLFFFDSH
jgi:hypothetical protein